MAVSCDEVVRVASVVGRNAESSVHVLQVQEEGEEQEQLGGENRSSHRAPPPDDASHTSDPSGRGRAHASWQEEQASSDGTAHDKATGHASGAASKRAAVEEGGQKSKQRMTAASLVEGCCSTAELLLPG